MAPGVLATVFLVLLVGCASNPPSKFGAGPPVVGSTDVSPSAATTPGQSLLPNLVGASEAKARKTLSRLGFVVAVDKRIVSMDQPPDYVTAQRPKPFRYLDKGTTIHLNFARAANQWGYNFGCCDLITTPPSNFCSAFHCVAKFHSTTGNVLECVDKQYTRAKKMHGACEGHSGPWRWLLVASS